MVGAAAWVRSAHDPGTCEKPEGSSAAGQGPGTGTHLSTSSQQLNIFKSHRQIIDSPALLVANGRFSFPASEKPPMAKGFPWSSLFSELLD